MITETFELRYDSLRTLPDTVIHVLSSANFSQSDCENPASWLLLSAQPLREKYMPFEEYVQRWAIRWAMGCVNPAS